MNYRRIIIIGLIITILIFIICLNGTVNESFNNSEQDILYEFKLGYGGIGDFIKFMRICKIESEIRNVKFYIDFDHPLNKYLKIHNKFTGNYDKNNVNIIKPSDYYYRFDKNSALQMNTINIPDFKPLDYFYINEDCKNRYNFLKNKNNIPDIYEGIHIRLGDSKMSSTKNNKDDDRVGKLDIYSKLDICIVHTSDENEDVKILDNLCDFLFLSNAKVIHSFTKSGFPIVASWIYNNKLAGYY